MTDRLYPEVIRGAWFLYKGELSDPTEIPLDECDLLVFRRDGTYSRHQTKPDSPREVEHGTHTFDGEFLITRGRSTETYRVSPHSETHWVLETKKHALQLIRHVNANRFDLDEAAARSIRILPMRARGSAWGDGATLVQPIVFAPQDAAPVTLGLASIELDRTRSSCWVGVSRLAGGLEDATWHRIVHESLFDLGLDDTDDITTLDVTFYGEPGSDTSISL